jgi:hypothetical protein
VLKRAEKFGFSGNETPWNRPVAACSCVAERLQHCLAETTVFGGRILLLVRHICEPNPGSLFIYVLWEHATLTFPQIWHNILQHCSMEVHINTYHSCLARRTNTLSNSRNSFTSSGVVPLSVGCNLFQTKAHALIWELWNMPGTHCKISIGSEKLNNPKPLLRKAEKHTLN